MEAKYKISEAEYVRANKLFTKLSKKTALSYGSITVILGLLAFIFPIKAVQLPIVGALVGGVLGHIVSRHLLAPWYTKNHYRSFMLMSEPITVQLTEDGVRFKTTDAKNFFKWGNFHKWRENREFLLLYSAPTFYQILPKKVASLGFPVDSLVETLTEKVGEKT